MRGRDVGRVALLLVCLAGASAGDEPARPLSAESTRVLADFKVSMAKLETLEATVTLTQTAPAPVARQFRMAFRKPFSFSVRNVQGETGPELFHHAGKISLHFPDTGQVLRMDLESGDSTVATFFQLFTLSSFVEGTALHDIEGHFRTEIFEEGKDYEIRLTPHDASVWGWALGLARVDARLAKEDLVPREVVLHERKEGALRETARLALVDIAYNQELSADVFVPVLAPGTKELDSYDVLLMWVQDMMLESGSKAADLVETWQGQVGDYLGGPWVPR